MAAGGNLRSSVLELPSLVSVPDRYLVAGVAVSEVRFDETLDLLLGAPQRGAKLRVHFAAMHTLVEAAKDAALRQRLNEADVIAPDGMPIVWLGRRQGRTVERFCGPDVMPALLDRSREAGTSHFFYGGTPEGVRAMVLRLKETYPNLNVAGYFSPPFRPLRSEEEDEVAQIINESGADYVWVGLGSPKQDNWLADFRPRLNASVLLAVGAAFDFQSGRVRRAPAWAQRHGVEWMFRLASEPRRLFRRYVAAGLHFCQLMLMTSRVRPEVK